MTTSNRVTMNSGAWYGDEELALTFPDGWQVALLAPHDAPPLSDAEIETAFAQPIGTSPLAELARGRRDAAIVVDDLSRPTPAADVLPFVLQELARAGISKDEIRIVVGGGSHRPIDEEEIAKKVGAQVAAEYQVFNHNFMAGDLRGLGSLPSGLPIYVNRIVADADFKICVGGIYPHGAVGFGGGSKLILPGVSGFATMFYFHTFYPGRGHAVIENGNGTPDHRDASEAVAKVLGLDAVVNVVLNSRRQVAGVFVGDYIQAHRAGAQFARQTYGTRIPESVRQETDLVVTNCYPLDSDALQTVKALWMDKYFERAYTVAVNPATDGICYHGLFGRIDWARFQQRKAMMEPVDPPTPYIGDHDQLLVWSQNFPADDFADKLKNGILFRQWEMLIEMLAQKLPTDAKVAVFPCGSIQVLADETALDAADQQQSGARTPQPVPA